MITVTDCQEPLLIGAAYNKEVHWLAQLLHSRRVSIMLIDAFSETSAEVNTPLKQLRTENRCSVVFSSRLPAHCLRWIN